MNDPSSRAEQPGARRIGWRAMALLHATLLLYAVSALFANFSGKAFARGELELTVWYLAADFVCLAVYALLWQQTLKRMPLTFAYANKAVCTLWTFLFGVLFFGEKVTLGKGIGIAVVLAGVCLVVTDRE